MALLTLGEVDKIEVANSLFNKARAIKPKFANAVYLYGFTLQKLGKPLEAIMAYKEAVRRNVIKSASFYDNWGYAIVADAATDRYHVDYPKIVDAIEKFKDAILEDPSYVYAYYDCGVALNILYKCDDAITLYQRALDVNNDMRLFKNFYLAYEAIKQAKTQIKENSCPPPQQPDLSAFQAAVSADTCLNPQPKETKIITSGKNIISKYGSSETISASQRGINPDVLTWILVGVLLLLSTGLVVFRVKRQRNTASTFTPGSSTTLPFASPNEIGASARSSVQQIYINDVTEKTSKPERYTHVGSYFAHPEPQWPSAILVGVSGTMQDRQFPVEKEICRIGSNSQNELYIQDDPYVSGNHAALRYTKGSLLIFDLGSTNGTFVNEERVSGETGRELMPGDRIRIGNTTLTVAQAR